LQRGDRGAVRAIGDAMRWIEQILEAIAAWIRRCIPAYEPATWNDNNGIQLHNNCYNYACNIQTGTFAQPGLATGHLRPEPFTCQGVGPAAQSDGLRPVDGASGCGCRDCCHKVALVIAPGPEFNDFHWYRLDRDDHWSHKPGGTPATNVDSSGNPITDPRTANRGPYTVFCGFYCVCKDKVSIA
jgi:hypothetical protein